MVKVWRDKDEWSGDLYKNDQDIPHISFVGGQMDHCTNFSKYFS